VLGWDRPFDVFPGFDSTVLAAGALASPAVPQAVLRGLLQSERESRPVTDRQAIAQGLCDVFLELPRLRHARCVALYESQDDQPGTDLLRAALADRGVLVLVAQLVGDDELAWNVDEPPPEGEASASGDEHPSVDAPGRHEAALSDADVVLVPALAVDSLGHRLGHALHDGYDRALRPLPPTTPVLAAVHDGEIFDAAVEPLAAGPRSVPVSAALTPTRVLPFAFPNPIG
jgi:5-formyltetrahydrofolate cyclo-ligase